jgi:hypothetical protein
MQRDTFVISSSTSMWPCTLYLAITVPIPLTDDDDDDDDDDGLGLLPYRLLPSGRAGNQQSSLLFASFALPSSSAPSDGALGRTGMAVARMSIEQSRRMTPSLVQDRPCRSLPPPGRRRHASFPWGEDGGERQRAHGKPPSGRAAVLPSWLQLYRRAGGISQFVFSFLFLPRLMLPKGRVILERQRGYRYPFRLGCEPTKELLSCAAGQTGRPLGRPSSRLPPPPAAQRPPHSITHGRSSSETSS